MLKVSNCKNVFKKPRQRLPHRVIEPPDVQCSNLFSTERNILLRIYILLLVLKNAKKVPNGKCMETFLKP